MSILDRYLIRQTIPPFLLALGLFTFVLAVEPMLDYAKLLLAKGVPAPTVGLLLLTLLPQALSLTIPMSLLTGILMALGRVSGDRESVAFLAGGVSPIRLLRPILLMALVVAGFDMYVLIRATPDANQAFLNITFRLLTDQTAADIRPRVFFDQFPGKVLYIRDVLPDGRWSGVFLADTANPERPRVTLAETGTLQIDRAQQSVRLVLEKASEYAPGKTDPRVYIKSTLDPASVAIAASAVFGTGPSIPGMHEMSYTALGNEIALKRAAGIPAHAEIMQRQQMFSFPVACLVLALVGFALGLNTRKEGRLAGLVLGLGVILIYYAVMALAEAWAKSAARDQGSVDLIATWARWVPNIVLGLVGVFALWRQTRPNGFNLPLRVPAWFRRERTAPRARVSDQPVVVLRLPDFVPVPRLLDRYVTWQYLRAAALAFLGLLSLYYIGAFVDLADKLKEPGDGWVFVNFLVTSTPQFIVLVIPIATLIAVLGTIGALTRTGELIVMRACGVSLYRAALPLFLCALVGSGLLFGIEERVLGEANRTASMLRDDMRDHPTDDPQARSTRILLGNHTWLVGQDGRIYHYALFVPADPANAGRPSIRGLSVFELATDGFRLRSHLNAARAAFDGTAWRLEQGWRQEFTGDAAARQDFDRETLALTPVADFQRAEVDPNTMGFLQAREYVTRLGASGFNVAEQRVNLHRRIAFPMVTLVMTLLAIPFGVTIGRKGTLYGIGLATVLAASYFLLMTFFVAFGAAGLLPPMLAAWGANILFSAGAVYMILTVRT